VYPHHIIQRGNRRQEVFFSNEDRKTCLDYLRLYAKTSAIDFWGYCLMNNHLHLIAVPQNEDSFARGFAEAHRRYTRYINFRKGWRGYLWEGRFKSYLLDEAHLYAAIRYIERNPVRAGIVKPGICNRISAKCL
jgi:putative transposase